MVKVSKGRRVTKAKARRGRRVTKGKSRKSRRGGGKMYGGNKMCGGNKMYGGDNGAEKMYGGDNSAEKMYGGDESAEKMYGGAQTVFPAPVEAATYDSAISAPSKMMLEMGTDYESIHSAQHGGAAVSLANSAPPGYTGMLDDSLRATARVLPLDQSTAEASGMSDQSGGRRRRKGTRRGRKGSRKGRKGSRKGRKGSRKGRKGSRKSRGGSRMMGGAFTPLSQAQDFSAPGMLLSPGQEAQALRGMNPEWELASDPKAFSPAGM